jgi:hypothetical protein
VQSVKQQEAAAYVVRRNQRIQALLSRNHLRDNLGCDRNPALCATRFAKPSEQTLNQFSTQPF